MAVTIFLWPLPSSQFITQCSVNLFMSELKSMWEMQEGRSGLENNCMSPYWIYWLILSKGEERSTFNMCTRSLSFFLSVVDSVGCGWWKEALLPSRWSWNTSRCSHCHHLWPQQWFHTLCHALKKQHGDDNVQEKGLIQQQILHSWIPQSLIVLLLDHIDQLHSFSCRWGHKRFFHLLPACS